MLAEVRRHMRRHGMLETNKPVWVAVSGGVDSMVLWTVMRELGHPCHIAHVDHGLRGAESDRDRAFVEEEARRCDTPFRSIRVDPMARAKADGASVEMAARVLRYAWFTELLAEGPHTMVLGHHGDDAIETLFLHLMRGPGMHGWGGIPPVTTLPTGRICRPLLTVGRAQVLHFAEQEGIVYREDLSNADPRYLRNRVRAEVLPLIEELRPGTKRTLSRSVGTLRELEAAAMEHVQREASDLWPSGDTTWRIPMDRLEASCAPHLLLGHLLKDLRPHPDQLEQILDAIFDKRIGAVFPIREKVITMDRSHLSITIPAIGLPTFSMNVDQVKEGVAGPFRWKADQLAPIGPPRDPHTVWLDRRALGPVLELRPWQQGDRMRPKGLGGSKLISDILIDAKVPRNEKPAAYILLNGEEIVWLAGHRVAEGYSAPPDAEDALWIGYYPVEGLP